MSKLKPCPFCGGKPSVVWDGDVMCKNTCRNFAYMPREEWNSRPIEDELRKQIPVWIPCSLRLPNEEERKKDGSTFNVTRRNGTVTAEYFDGNHFWADDDPYHWDDIIAWQPLPPPYEEVK